MRRVGRRPLWVGHAGDLRDPLRVLAADVRAVVELADAEPMAVFPRDVVRCRFPLSDGGDNPPWLLKLTADAVASLVRAGVPVLVACSAGMSRSVAAAAAGLAVAEGWSPDEALAAVVGGGPADVSPRLWGQFRAVLVGGPPGDPADAAGRRPG